MPDEAERLELLAISQKETLQQKAAMTKQTALLVMEMSAIEEERQDVYDGMRLLIGALRYLRAMPQGEENGDAIGLLEPVEAQMEGANSALRDREGELWERILAADGPGLTSKELETETDKICRGERWICRILKRLVEIMPEQGGKGELLAQINDMGSTLRREVLALRESQRKYQRSRADVLARQVLGYAQ